MIFGTTAIALSYSTFGKMGNAFAEALDSGNAIVGFKQFMQVSASLTGVDKPDEALGKSILAAFNALNNQTPQLVTELPKYLKDGVIVPDAPAEISAFSSALLKAWYMGIVGQGEQTRCVAYEHALNYAPISDVCVLPSYARGEPHYWAQPPFPSPAI